MDNCVKPGENISGDDFADVAELVDKIVLKSGDNGINAVYLPLVLAEINILRMRDGYPDEKEMWSDMKELREMAKLEALKIREDFKRWDRREREESKGEQGN